MVQTGEVGVQGVEFEARANLSENVTLVGGFSFLDIRKVHLNSPKRDTCISWIGERLLLVYRTQRNQKLCF